ncbi:MAG: agmatinase family protein [Anaerolineales bacterium]|nr:agmatinase family protein [Anaerolineales bacterium]
MHNDLLDQLTLRGVALLGAPYDANSSFLRGAALAPPRIRELLYSPGGNWSIETGRDLQPVRDWLDLGDLTLPPQPGRLEALTEAALSILQRGARLLTLGGDHSITYALIYAYAQYHQPLTILHLDAHPDLYDELDGNRWSHACPFARILEAGLAQRLVQVGVRAVTDHLRQQAARFGVQVIEMQHWQPGLDLGLETPFYLSLDLDVLDPAFAPGVSHPEAGGMSVRDVLGLLRSLPGPLIGADLVEYNPTRDPVGITAAAAAKLCKEILGQMRL